MPFHVAFLTSAELPHLTPDDRLAAEALEKDGISVEPLVWGGAVPRVWDAVVVRSPWSYYERPAEFAAWLGTARLSGLSFWNSLDLVRWNLDKRYLGDLAEAGVPIVPTRRWDRGTPWDSVERGLREFAWPLLVLKPEVSAGAFRTVKAALSDLGAARPVAGEVLAEGGLMAQPFVDSVQTEGELSLIYFRGREVVFSHGLRKRPRPGDFRVQEKFGGSVVRDDGGPEWDRVARQALQALPFPWLYARVDLVRWEGGPVVGEVEVFEPELFFRLAARSVTFFTQCLRDCLATGSASR